MLKIERKVLLWVEKHMFVLLAVLAAVMGLYLRRGAVWWSSPDAGYYFDGHEGNIQSGCYHLLVRLVQYLPMLPLHTVKWLAAAADYAVAVLAVIAVGGHREGEKLKSSFYFTGCILSPVAYLRGSCWAQVDSAAFALLLGAYIVWGKGQKIPGILLAMAGIALYPPLLVMVFCWIFFRRESFQREDYLYLGILFVGCCLLQGMAGLLSGRSWMEGLRSLTGWMSREPYQGTVYADPLAWGIQMGNLLGYGAAMVSGMAAYRHRISYGTALLIHLAVLLIYGSVLFPAGM